MWEMATLSLNLSPQAPPLVDRNSGRREQFAMRDLHSERVCSVLRSEIKQIAHSARSVKWRIIKNQFPEKQNIIYSPERA
jgi:hypothetical protein